MNAETPVDTLPVDQELVVANDAAEGTIIPEFLKRTVVQDEADIGDAGAPVVTEETVSIH